MFLSSPGPCLILARATFYVFVFFLFFWPFPSLFPKFPLLVHVCPGSGVQDCTLRPCWKPSLDTLPVLCCFPGCMLVAAFSTAHPSLLLSGANNDASGSNQAVVKAPVAVSRQKSRHPWQPPICSSPVPVFLVCSRQFQSVRLFQSCSRVSCLFQSCSS